MNEPSGNTTKSHKRMIVTLAGIAIGMFVFGFAMVPLYKLLCQVAGLQSVGSASRMTLQSDMGNAQSESRWVTVKFDATISRGLPWEFKPVVRKIRVRTGETNDVSYIAKNLSDERITGQAIPSIVPWQATQYFSKTECFCLQQQVLEPRQEKEMKLRFIVSPVLPDNIESLTLSYTFMNTGTESVKKLRAGMKTETVNNYKTGSYAPAAGQQSPESGNNQIFLTLR